MEGLRGVVIFLVPSIFNLFECLEYVDFYREKELVGKELLKYQGNDGGDLTI